MKIPMKRLLCRVFRILSVLFATCQIMPPLDVFGQGLVQGDKVTIGETSYVVRTMPAQVSSWEADELCIWHDGKVWVIDRRKPNLKTCLASRWPVLCVSADRTRAVVRVAPEGERSEQLGVADLTNNNLIFSVQQGEFTPDTWSFSPDKRYAWVINGMGNGGYHYLDLEQQKLVVTPVAGMKSNEWYYWTGAPPNKGASLCLWVRHAPWDSRFRRVTINPPYS